MPENTVIKRFVTNVDSVENVDNPSVLNGGSVKNMYNPCKRRGSLKKLKKEISTNL